jgi:hypothetical protein
VVKSKLSELLQDVEHSLVEAAEAVWERFSAHQHTQGAAERMLQVGCAGGGAFQCPPAHPGDSREDAAGRVRGLGGAAHQCPPAHPGEAAEGMLQVGCAGAGGHKGIDVLRLC